MKWNRRGGVGLEVEDRDKWQVQASYVEQCKIFSPISDSNPKRY